jgi:hypothetical protein
MVEASSLINVLISSNQAQKPAYTLGRIKSKYLIAEMTSFSGFGPYTSHLLSKSCRQLKQMVVQNYQVFTRLRETSEIRIYT